MRIQQSNSLLVAMVFALSTGACKERLVTHHERLVLSPERQQTFDVSYVHYPANTVTWPCGISENGTGLELPPAEGFVGVGYETTWDHSGAVLPCDWALEHFLDGGVRFDLSVPTSRKPRVFARSAILEFTRVNRGRQNCPDILKTAVSRFEDITGNNTSPATEKYTYPALTSGGPCSATDGRCSIDVTGQVNDWITGRLRNDGFLIMPAKVVGWRKEITSFCRTDYGKFTLTVDYSWDTPA